MIKIPFLNKFGKRKKYSNQRASKKNYIPKKETNNRKSHSFIYNYSGLNNILFQYSSNKGDNKNIADEDSYITEDKNKVQKKSVEYIERNSSLTKLKEMNSDMDLILTGIKTNLEGSTINSDKNAINVDKFINQINNKYNNNPTFNNKIKKDAITKTYEYLKYSFSYMKISSFNFEIINKKKHYINIDKLKEKSKYDYIFDNHLNQSKIDIESIINMIYNYKNKIDDIKLSNKSMLSKYFINEKEINKEFEKFLEINKINEENKMINNEIDFLTEKLTYSFYKGELLLNRYYNKLKEMDINVKKSIKDIIDNSIK